MIELLRNSEHAREKLADKMWRLDNLYTIVNERGIRVPFKLRPVQREYLESSHGLDVILKSRQHGFTTLICVLTLDDCLFNNDLSCGIIAHTKLDAAAIFQNKIRTPYECLPEVIRSTCPATKLDGSELRLANGSSIRVAVSFRSATTHRLHISEYGKICAKFPSRAEEIKTGTLPSVHPQQGGRISVESTAEGAAGHFYELCRFAEQDTARSAKSGIPLNVKAYKFHFVPWHVDPKNAVDPVGVDFSDEMVRYLDELKEKIGKLSKEQRAWYAITKDGAGGLGREMKREHPSTPEEAFESHIRGAVYASELEAARASGRIGKVPYMAGAPVYTAWDIGVGDATVVWFFQIIGKTIRLIDYYAQAGRGAAYHAKQVLQKPYVYDSTHRWAFMPHDIMSRDKATGVPLADTYEAYGIKVQPTRRPNRKADGIEAVRGLFGQMEFDLSHCDNAAPLLSGLKGLAYYRYEWNEDFNAFGKDPVHDWTSHPADALQTLALAYKYEMIGGEYVGDSKAVAGYYGDVQEDYDPLDFPG